MRLVMIRPSSTFRWLRTGEAALAAMLSAIQASQESVRLETYLFHAGPLAERFREALVLAARRGAKVRVLIDALGSLNLSAEFWDPLKKAGGEFVWFNPLSLTRWSCRDHRKILVCDDARAFIAGFKIADEYKGDSVTRAWRGTGPEISESMTPQS